MSIYTPVFIETRKLLYSIIGELISKNLYTTPNQIHGYIKGLKEGDQKKFELIDFTYNTLYSDEVQEVIVDMIRHCLIEITNRGYELTLLGKSFIGKEDWI